MADQNALTIQSADARDLPTLLQVGRARAQGALPELIGSIKSLRDAFSEAETGGTESVFRRRFSDLARLRSSCKRRRKQVQELGAQVQRRRDSSVDLF